MANSGDQPPQSPQSPPQEPAAPPEQAEPANSPDDSLIQPSDSHDDNLGSEMHLDLPDNDPEKENDPHDADLANSSALRLPILSSNQFTTPAKSLPPLKDIDQIDTPKSFAVAQDAESSPIVHRDPPVAEYVDANGNDSMINYSAMQSDKRTLVAALLGVNATDLPALDDRLVDVLAQKSVEVSELRSENQFFQLNQERASQLHEKRLGSLQQKLEASSKALDTLQSQYDELASSSVSGNANTVRLESQVTDLQAQLAQINESYDKIQQENLAVSGKLEEETLNFNRQVTQLTRENVEQRTKVSELTKEINQLKNDGFTLKFELSKANNEAAHFKQEKQWFETEWRNIQDKFTEISKQHQTQRASSSNKISELESALEISNKKNAQLSITVKNHEAKIEDQLNKLSSSETRYEREKLRLEKEIQHKDEQLELMNVQSSEKTERIKQLEDFADDLRSKSNEAVARFESELNQKEEQLLYTKERLRRAEEALEDELRNENDLPRLAATGELIASNAKGISLSTLYSEFSHTKKQLALERSQKERLAEQLETFVNELESKKPILLSYKDQIAFYETSMKEMVGKIESVRFEKLDSDKKCNRLKTQLLEMEDEMVGMKKLCKDLGKQLCYYLIHSKIRDDDDDPLTVAERKAIDNIMEKTGNNQNVKESDTDMLISERLVSFANIVELQQKNTDLLTVIRQLGKKLELQDNNSNKELESAAIEEAKEAILTLQGELESLTTRYEAVIKERDVLKSSGSGVSSHLDGEIKYVNEVNADLRNKLKDSEARLYKLRDENNNTVKNLKERLEVVTHKKDELTMTLISMKHTVELIESKYNNSQQALSATREELAGVNENSKFWKEQAAKHENLLVNKSNELKELENKVAHQLAAINNLNGENRLLTTLQQTLQSDNDQLKNDKTQLNEFVINLQALLKERQEHNAELSQRLDQSIQNYQSLQQKLSEREERIQILANQSELAYKAQNSKLEQVNDLSHLLLSTKTQLEAKTQVVEALEKKVKDLSEHLAKSDTHIKALQINPNSTHKSSVSEASTTAVSGQDLHLAELQIAELSRIAKSAEDTLVNVTNSFEEFRSENEKIQESLKIERNELQDTVRKVQEEAEKLQKELEGKESQHSLALHELQLKLQTSEDKSQSVDKLQKDFEEKISGLRSELDVYVQLANENQKKFAVEQQLSEKYAQELAIHREESDKLQESLNATRNELNNARIALESSSGAVSEEKSKMEEELNLAKSKLEDVSNQNKILLNQLELLKVPGNSGVNTDSTELQEVIAFLRREKESYEAKASTLEEEVSRLQRHLESVTAELEATKTRLTESSSNTFELQKYNEEHQRLLEQLQEINILRDSNKLLRGENEGYLKQLQGFEDQIKTLQDKIDSSEKELDTIRLAVDEKTQEIKLLKEENQKLFENANSTANAPNSTEEDEEKLTEVQGRFDELQARFDRLLNESQTKLRSARAKEKEFQRVVDSLNAEVAQLKSDIDELRDKHANEVAEIKKAASSKPESNEADEKTIQTLADEKRNLENEVKKLQQINSVAAKAQSVALEKEVNKVKSQFETERQKLQQDYDSRLKEELSKVQVPTDEDTQKAVDEWKAKYTELESSFEESRRQLVADYETKLNEAQNNQLAAGDANPELVKSYESQITQLKQEFASQLEKEKQQARQQTEKKFEIKIRMLNKKLEKFNSPKPEAKEDEPKQVVPAFGESTLSVRQPSPADANDKKRPAAAEQNPTTKKPKDS